MVIKSIRISARIIYAFSIIFLLCPVILFLLVLSEPRSLASLNPYVERELNSINPNFNVKFANSFIKWDNAQHAVIIEVDDVNILNKSNEVLAAFPKVSFDFSIMRLLRGRIVSSDITLINPSFYIDTSLKKFYINAAGNEEDIQVALAGIMLSALKIEGSEFPINSIKIKDAELLLNNGTSEFGWQIKSGYARLDNSKKRNKILSELNIKFNNEETYIGAELFYNAEGYIDTKFTFNNLPSNVLQDMFPEAKILKNFDVKAGGNVDILISEKGESEQIKFNFTSLSGTAFFEDYIKNKLNIKSLKAEGSISENFSLLTIENMSADINNIPFVFTGSLKNRGSFVEIVPEIKANFVVNDLNVNDIDGYWPVNFAPKSRNWVVSNTKDGKIIKAEGNINLTPADIANIEKWQENHAEGTVPEIAKDAIKAALTLEGVSVHYNNELLPEPEEISGANFNLNINDYEVSGIGDGRLRGNRLNIDFYKDLRSNNNARYHVVGEVSAAYLADLKIADIPYISGGFDIDINMIKNSDGSIIQGIVDVTKATVNIAEAGFVKPAGAAGIVNFNASEIARGVFDVKSFTAEGEGFSAAGNMKIENNELVELKLEHAKFANNDFNASYSAAKDKNIVDLAGEKIDLGNVSFGKYFKHVGYNKKGLELKVNVKNVHMKNSEILRELSANASCTAKICKTFAASANLRDNNYLLMKIKKAKEGSALILESDNAGALVNAIGVSPNIRGGNLNMEATFADNGDFNIAKGVIIMRNFTAVKTPILGRLLTLASLQGIVDLLDNEGISFEKFEAPFNVSGEVITVTDARSAGSSVGITANGNINTESEEVDLKGAIVPAYELNKAISKVPLVGGLLIGKKNEGLIASRYSINGNYSDAKISVNPLSILTPGFLRNIFDVLP